MKNSDVPAMRVFGDVVPVDNKLVRVSANRNEKKWLKRQITSVQAIYLGERHLSDGSNEWWDGVIEYTPKHRFKASLVAIPNRKPFYALLAELEASKGVNDSE
jgi:hypothetical protein